MLKLLLRTGSGREAAIRALQATGLEVGAIRDVTPVPREISSSSGASVNMGFGSV